jgi:hypothetical protein
MADDKCSITVTRSAGKDSAVVIFIDGDFTGQGLRILVNDNDAWKDTAFEPNDDPDVERPARDVRLDFRLSDTEYLDA